MGKGETKVTDVFNSVDDEQRAENLLNFIIKEARRGIMTSFGKIEEDDYE